MSIDRVDVELLADAIGAAIDEAEAQRIGKIVARRAPRDLPADSSHRYSPRRLSEIIRADPSLDDTTACATASMRGRHL
jgi:hypothetical protein